MVFVLRFLSEKENSSQMNQKMEKKSLKKRYNYQNFIEMTSNMIYIVAFGGGLKCQRKIHLNTQCPPPLLR